MLLNVLLISGGVHALALFILGGITIVKFVLPDEAEFEEPPAIEEVEPPKDVKVEIKQQPTPQMDASRNLSMRSVGNIAVSSVNVNLPSMDQSFTVSSGLGDFRAGSLMGSSRGSLNFGVSNVSIFGLKTKAERLLFVIDTNRHMVTDKKGGLNSYRVIKEEITQMVGNLGAGTLFNVMVYDRRKSILFKPSLVPSGTEVHRELERWMGPFNANADKVGLEGNSSAKVQAIHAMDGDPIEDALAYSGDRGNETAYLTQLALEQQVDGIFFISGYHSGFERIRRKPTDKENEEWKKKSSDKKYQEQLAEHKLEIPKMEKRVREELARINKERAAKNMPPRVLGQRYGVYSNAQELGLKWEIPHPGWQPAHFYEPRETEKYFKDLVDKMYTDKNLKSPSVNVVLFLAGDESFSKEQESRLKDYARFFSGKYRIIRGEDEIKSARSAQGTKN
ncbi:hypothetical protein [Coraliomargarita parva]|uniref:hypothetical protein n=1 Tax=Coraliomargarita parva TaxID=3014050 RepID=UPI0022B4E4B6|nr:hypothetical protein [Coraliomargarita parva]